MILTQRRLHLVRVSSAPLALTRMHNGPKCWSLTSLKPQKKNSRYRYWIVTGSSVLESNIGHRDDEHYEILLPLIEDRLKLPSNRTLALSRLERLKQRLKRDRKYREYYEAFMKEMIDKGQAQKVPDEELHLSDGRVWYIPHNGIYHPQKPDRTLCRLRCQCRIQRRVP